MSRFFLRSCFFFWPFLFVLLSDLWRHLLKNSGAHMTGSLISIQLSKKLPKNINQSWLLFGPNGMLQTFFFPLLLICCRCPKCKALKPKFSDEKLQELAKKFIVVNVDSDAVKLPEKYSFALRDPLASCLINTQPWCSWLSHSFRLSPDGSYIPRIIFLNDEGDLLPVVYACLLLLFHTPHLTLTTVFFLNIFIFHFIQQRVR